MLIFRAPLPPSAQLAVVRKMSADDRMLLVDNPLVDLCDEAWFTLWQSPPHPSATVKLALSATSPARVAQVHADQPEYASVAAQASSDRQAHRNLATTSTSAIAAHHPVVGVAGAAGWVCEEMATASPDSWVVLFSLLDDADPQDPVVELVAAAQALTTP